MVRAGLGEDLMLANEVLDARRLGKLSARVTGAVDSEETIIAAAKDGAYDLATSFLVVHEILPEEKVDAFAAVARALKRGGAFVIFDETYPETDEGLRTMPSRFAALAQWYELTWGNRVNTRTELLALCEEAGLRITEETSFSRFYIGVATKA